MSNASQTMRKALASSLDALELINYGDGFEAALDGLDELSNQLHNDGETAIAETLRWAAKELRGENV